MKKLSLWNGKPSAYGFACGLAQVFNIDADNRMRMYKEHNAFHIVGFEQGKHFHHCHRFLSDAHETFRCCAARMQNDAAHRRWQARLTAPKESKNAP